MSKKIKTILILSCISFSLIGCSNSLNNNINQTQIQEPIVGPEKEITIEEKTSEKEVVEELSETTKKSC